MTDVKLRPWELALLGALIVTLCAGLWARKTQTALSGELIRLHVVASSDSREDQAAKLAMRDRVLAVVTPLLRDCGSRQEAEAVLRQNLYRLEALGDVRVTLEREYYPTRDYDTFSLPAGEYLSLRVIMGRGAGHNWWCVVYPALCTEVLTEDTEDAFLRLDGEQTALITRADEEYVIKFRLVEWWGELKEMLTPGA